MISLQSFLPLFAALDQPVDARTVLYVGSYLVAAALLGARLLWYCVQLIRESGVTPTAWKMYRYSLLYLFLLFLAMGIDRYLPGQQRIKEPQPEMIILKQDDAQAKQAAKEAGLELPFGR